MWIFWFVFGLINVFGGVGMIELGENIMGGLLVSGIGLLMMATAIPRNMK